LSAGNLAVVGVFISSGSSSHEFSSFAHDGTDTYTLIHSSAATSAISLAIDARTYYAKNVSAGAVTITVNTNSAVISSAFIGIQEYSGADTSSPLDADATFNQQDNPGTGAGAITSSSVNTIANGEIIVSFALSSRGGVVNYTAGSGYTTRDTYPSSQGIGEDQIQGSSGMITATATQDYSDAVTSNFTDISTFKAAGGGGGATCNGAFMLLGVAGPSGC
jgi:hypothetical protein